MELVTLGIWVRVPVPPLLILAYRKERENEMSEERRLTIIYHNNCYDGVTAAWVCMKRFQAERPNLRAIPRNYSDPIPEDIDGDDVVVVDFSWPLAQMKDLYIRSNSLIVLDHHKTAQENLEKLPEIAGEGPPEVSKLYIVFDMNRSGAGIAWDYFFSKDSRPDLVNYVEDRDLWRYALPHSREYNAYIQSFDIGLETWFSQFNEGELDVEDREVGRALLRQQSKLVKQIAYNAYPATLPDIWICGSIPPAGIYVQTSILMSEVCEQMLVDHPESHFAFYSFTRKDGKTQYGLRSRAGSSIDVSDIAKLYGGGGHPNAAGFEI